MARIKRILDAVWEAFRYLFLTPSWGSKRRAEQREYERMLEEKGEERTRITRISRIMTQEEKGSRFMVQG